MLPDKKTPQVITAILFADIVGYSKLSELQVLSFVENFLGTVRDLIDASPLSARPVVKNTWGDGTMAVSCCLDTVFVAHDPPPPPLRVHSVLLCVHETR